MIPEELIEKIRKLEALANNAGATQAESENAAAKIQDIILKYNLDQEELTAKMGQGQKPKNPVGHEFKDLTPFQGKSDANYASDLLIVCAKFNLCKAILVPEPKAKFIKKCLLVGKKDNIDLVWDMFTCLCDQIMAAEIKAYKIYTGEITNRNTYTRGYYRGAVKGIAERFAANEQELKELNPGMGLMIVNSGKEVGEYVEQHFNLSRGKARRGLSGRDGYKDGYRDSKDMQHRKSIN